MAQRFQNQSRRGSGGRPNRGWSGQVSTAVVNIPANSAVLLGGFALTNPGIDVTVLRTVGSIYINTDQTAANEQQIGAFGFILVTDTAFAVGITAIPDPIGDVGDDGWFVYVPIQQDFTFATAVGQIVGMKYDFDSKAKRVIHNGTTIAVVIANSDAGDGFNVTVGFRILSQVRGTR